jgi:two-component system nitrogen regulation sensor histidine kinase NtrY
MAENGSFPQKRKTNWRKIIPIFIPVLVITILMTAEYIIRQSPQFQYTRWYTPFLSLLIININIILILVLLVVIFRNLVKLFGERKKKILGSKFRTKLVLTMIFITIIPTLLIYLTAQDLISKSIDRWYAQPLEDIVVRSNALAKTYQEDYKLLVRKHALDIAQYISDENLLRQDKEEYLWRLVLVPMMADIKFDVLDVYLGDQPLTPTLVSPDTAYLPYIQDPTPEVILQTLAKQRSATPEYYSEIDTPRGILLRCVVPIFDKNDESPEATAVGAVAIGFGIRKYMVDTAAGISGDYQAYQEQMEQPEVVKLASQALLLVFTLMSLFSAIWIGIYFSKGITVPIQKLAEGTRRIASGDLDYRVEAASSDELGILVGSFNEMTKDLKQSKEELEQANRDLQLTNLEIERRRRYTETLLSNLSSAVVSLDANGKVTTINPSARNLLELPSRGQVGKHWRDVLGSEELAPLRKLIEDYFGASAPGAATDMELRLGEQILHLSATITPVRHTDKALRGTLIVLDDLTQLVRAQRTSAWREVAQRIAHEIKNPLTPIQLSAERILKKIRDGEGDFRELISECTETIIQETGSLKSMVDAFSSFARMPPISRVRTNINTILDNAVSIYRSAQDGRNGFRIVKHLDKETPEFDLDPDLLKMAFVNIINNAIDAMEGRGKLLISSTFDAEKKRVMVEFTDDGPGIPAEVKDKLFLPYFSTKKKGTGLGLAIVHRIVTDHNGTISVSDVQPHGARFAIELPVD